MTSPRRKCLRAMAILALLALPVMGCLGLILLGQMDPGDPLRCEFRSGKDPRAEFWLVEEGFMDRGLSLHSRDPATRAVRRVATLDWEGFLGFENARWTKDGKVAAFEVRPAGGGSPTLLGFACDFEGGTFLLPRG